jgi:hypothetical protein
MRTLRKTAVAGGARLVNLKYSRIFNGVFEKQKSTKNEKSFAKIRVNLAWTSRVYHDRVKHDARLREIYRLLKQRLRHKSATGSSAYRASRPCGTAQLRSVRPARKSLLWVESRLAAPIRLWQLVPQLQISTDVLARHPGARIALKRCIRKAGAWQILAMLCGY